MKHVLRQWPRFGSLLIVLLIAACATNNNLIKAPADRDQQVKALVDLGVGYLKNQDYPRAKDNLNKALELDPNSAEAHNALALVFQLEQEYGEAEEQFKMAIRSDPGFTRARNNYGAFLFGQKKYDEAIKQLKIAAEDQYYSERPTVFENLGISYLRTGDKDAAEKAFLRAIALNPRQARSLLELAEMRMDQRKYADARNLFARFESVSQDNATSLWLCVRLARIFKDSNKEASCSLALKNIYPTSPEYKAYEASVSQ